VPVYNPKEFIWPGIPDREVEALAKLIAERFTKALEALVAETNECEEKHGA
jgi:hypothetical protein